MEESYINIGKIDINMFKPINVNITTNEVVLTSERLKHILERHKEDFELFFYEISNILLDPDYRIFLGTPTKKENA